jgi:hypothetical protein
MPISQREATAQALWQRSLSGAAPGLGGASSPGRSRRAPGAAAVRLLSAAFPMVLTDHINAPYAEQRSHNAALAALLRSEAWAADLAAAHLGAIVRAVLLAIDTFERRYTASRSEVIGVRWDEVRAADAEAHEGLCRLVAAILVAAEDDPALETRLLRPVLDEQEATRRSPRRAAAPAEASGDVPSP